MGELNLHVMNLMKKKIFYWPNFYLRIVSHKELSEENKEVWGHLLKNKDSQCFIGVYPNDGKLLYFIGETHKGFRRKPSTFTVLGALVFTLLKGTIMALNELDCTYIHANSPYQYPLARYVN